MTRFCPIRLALFTLCVLLISARGGFAADLSQAYALMERQDYARAEPLLRSELTQTGNPEAHYLLGFLLVETYRYEDAESHLRQAVEAQPGQSHWLMALAKSLLEQGRNLAAAETLQEAIAIAPRAAYYHAHAVALLNAGELDRAEASWRDCLALDSAHAGALSFLGGLLLDQDRVREALPLLERAVTANPANIDALYHLGTAHRQEGNAETAQAEFRAVLEQVPGHVGALHNLGRMLLEQGLEDEARPVLQQFQAMSKLRDDIDYYAFAVKKNPGNLDGRLHLAGLYLQAGRNTEARDAYLAARRQAPRDARIYSGLATAYRRLGEPDNAQRASDYASALERAGRG